MTLGIDKRAWRFAAVITSGFGAIAMLGAVILGWSWEPAAYLYGFAYLFRANGDHVLGEVEA